MCPVGGPADPETVKEVRQRVTGWTGGLGLPRWQQDRMATADPALFGVLIAPGARPDGQLLIAQWFTAMTIIDEYCDNERYGLDAARSPSWTALASMALVAGGRVVGSGEAAPFRVVRAAREALACHAPPGGVERVCREAERAFHKHSCEFTWKAQGRFPTVREYMDFLHLTAYYPLVSMLDSAHGHHLPEEVFFLPGAQRMMRLAAISMDLLNDVYSAEWEQEDDTSLPRAIARERGCSLREAVEAGIDTHNDTMSAYQWERGQLLEALGPHPQAERFIGHLEAAMAGNHAWHLATRRYVTPLGKEPA